MTSSGKWFCAGALTAALLAICSLSAPAAQPDTTPGAPTFAGLNAGYTAAPGGNVAAPKPADAGAPGQILTVEFLKPVDKEYQLTLYSEQPIEARWISAP